MSSCAPQGVIVKAALPHEDGSAGSALSAPVAQYLQKPSVDLMRRSGAVVAGVGGDEAVLIDTGLVIFCGTAAQVRKSSPDCRTECVTLQ